MKFAYLLTLIIVFSQCSPKETNLVWSDEFDDVQKLGEKWNIVEGNGCPELCGFGNNELQYYTALEENLKVENGKLIIQALKDHNRTYTSAKLTTEKMAEWQYGYIEVRAKLPDARGTWPAIWMLPTLDKRIEWPKDGEIDIMEYVGYNPGTVYGTIHTESYNHIKGTEKSDSIKVEDADENFHTYAIHWTDQKIEWLVDDNPYHVVYKKSGDNSTWPFDKKFHLIINLAVGGNWGGKYGVDDQSFPQEFVIDYVRVYSEKPTKTNYSQASID
ncbi:glycoside hydrolase family 16 protein [Marivirga arenosa]|uniref:Glycoside hydrolase family 16 protein n=1 Tax=Marivirga arenosa TaxID=3059076 RepID=A0AA51N5V2_9BACT|nr:glycoside hydrolase family 16 protein [Marivirga sp. ABR2-2]WMN06598.1 glycoside hydrolase family 16 protein [Marivirga sp. ABR2-2]